jgi:hypothetical protein
MCPQNTLKIFLGVLFLYAKNLGWMQSQNKGPRMKQIVESGLTCWESPIVPLGLLPMVEHKAKFTMNLNICRT